jgi:hypothetical protein
MFSSVPRPRHGQTPTKRIRLLSWRGKRKPRPLRTIGVWAVDTSEEATPQLHGEPRIARGWLSSPSPGRGGHRQKRFPPTSRMRLLQRILLRVFKLRARSVLLRSSVSTGGSTRPVSRLQPSLPAGVRRATVSRATPDSIPKTPTHASTESDGSHSCIASSFWQSRLRETR